MDAQLVRRVAGEGRVVAPLGLGPHAPTLLDSPTVHPQDRPVARARSALGSSPPPTAEAPLTLHLAIVFDELGQAV